MHIGTPVKKQFSWSSAVRAKHAALPNEHGAWVFLFSPLAVGLAAGGLHPASFLLVLGALAAFLIRQPLTIAVKALSGRRPKSDLPNAAFWLAAYGLLGGIAAAALIFQGYGFLLYLAVPAVPVFIWHLWLVSRRAERRQMLIEVVASGVLALAAPAAFWVGKADYDPVGWLLWLLCWMQVVGTILYAYLRLNQRALKSTPTLRESYRMARPALFYNLAALAVVIALAAGQIVTPLLVLAYLIQPIETVWGTLRPAVGVMPKAIGIRQLIVSTLFTVVFILAWIFG